MVFFRITYARYADLHDDVMQMMRGGVLVRVDDVANLELDTPAKLELVLPDGTTLTTDVRVLQVLAGHGVAVTVEPALVEQLRDRAGKDAGTAPAKHERFATSDPRPASPTNRPVEPSRGIESMSTTEKIQLALHGNRDQRMAILRDPNRTLHPYVLKNPQVTSEDVLAFAKSTTVSPEMLKQIGERKDWLQKPQIALALARNPKTPGDVAVRALDYVGVDALRQLAKGQGALPHVVAAARKKVIKP